MTRLEARSTLCNGCPPSPSRSPWLHWRTGATPAWTPLHSHLKTAPSPISTINVTLFPCKTDIQHIVVHTHTHMCWLFAASQRIQCVGYMQCGMRHVELQTLQCVRTHSDPWQDGASMSNGIWFMKKTLQLLHTACYTRTKSVSLEVHLHITYYHYTGQWLLRGTYLSSM